MDLNELKKANVNVLQSILSFEIRNYIDNQLILKILSDKFSLNIEDYNSFLSEVEKDALDLLSVSNKDFPEIE